MNPNPEQMERDRAALNDEQAKEKLIRWIGSRTRRELKIIVARKRNIYRYMNENEPPENYADELERETDALLIAAANLRRNQPKDGRILEQIDRERQARAAARPKPGTVASKVYEDLEMILEAREKRATWDEIVKTLRKSGKYKGHRITADQIRTAAQRIIKQKKKAAQMAAEQEKAPA